MVYGKNILLECLNDRIGSPVKQVIKIQKQKHKQQEEHLIFKGIIIAPKIVDSFLFSPRKYILWILIRSTLLKHY